MKIDIPNKNFGSLLQHAAMVNHSKYSVYQNRYLSYCICSKINSDVSVYIYKPNRITSTSIEKNIIEPHSPYSKLLVHNIKSLANHYIKYFNLPKPEIILIKSGYVSRCVSDSSNEVYQIICMFRLLRYKNRCNSYVMYEF